MLAIVLTCLTAVVSSIPGGISVECAPLPTPAPIITAAPTPIPTIAPTPAPTIAPTSAQAAQACANSITNGQPLPPCVGTSFFPGGIYRRTIATSAQPAANSAAMVAAYFGGAGNTISGLMWHTGAGQSVYSYGRPVYRAAVSDPLVSVKCTTYCAMGSATVRVPARAAAEGGSDHHIAIAEPDNTLFDAWEWARTGAGSATAGSLAISTYDGSTYSANDIAPGFMRSGETAGGMITPAGVVTLAELQAGVITHEIYGVVSCVASSWVPPATQTARVCTDGRPAIPLGSLLQYVPDGAAIASSSMSAESKIIALAAHMYGIRISDTGGSSGLMIQVESQSSFWSYGAGADPFVTYAQAHGWTHVVASGSPPIDRYIHPLSDLNLPSNLRVLAPGN